MVRSKKMQKILFASNHMDCYTDHVLVKTWA